MQNIEDCLGRIYRPLKNCANCKKDILNLNCSHYKPHNQLELIELIDEYGEQGTIAEQNLTNTTFVKERQHLYNP